MRHCKSPLSRYDDASFVADLRQSDRQTTQRCDAAPQLVAAIQVVHATVASLQKPFRFLALQKKPESCVGRTRTQGFPETDGGVL